MCTPSFMCKFPFSGRVLLPRETHVLPLAAIPPRAIGAAGGHSLCEIGRRHTNDAIERLRLAIDCMPVATREAMLEGVRANERVIVGAYVDDRGGVCPMLAAHRCGGRTDFLSFAKSWDRFTRAAGSSRAASPREVRILIAQLEDSLMSSSGLELDRAIKEHRALRSRRLRSTRRLPTTPIPSGRSSRRASAQVLARESLGDNVAARGPSGSPPARLDRAG